VEWKSAGCGGEEERVEERGGMHDGMVTQMSSVDWSCVREGR